MDLIDCHVHVYPEKIAGKAAKNVAGFYDLDTELSGDIKTLLKEGGKAGIKKYLLLPVANTTEHIRSINDFTIKTVSENECFFGFGTLHPDMQSFQPEIDHIKNSGLLGIKLHPDTQRFNMDSQKAFEIYDLLQSIDMPVMIHCGDKRFEYSHPKRLKRVLENFPRLRVIAAHLGGWSVFEEAFELLKNEKCLLDISSCMPFLDSDQMVRYIRGYGAHRILFGTDFPLWKPENEVESFLKLPLTNEEKELIAYKNAGSLLS